MYLKRLEIQGFKSLADKIELQFNQGITAVVGPNGSGKSNIADSIRWVLGEQSAKSLRGSKMEDIIFSGSDKRKSVGMAEVSLTLDNSDAVFPLDFAEITVTRRVYRSGESEYLINKSVCKLREIHEIFMDTGIGREGYSIIGQGKIDEILSSKSEDRRIIIEEAAGIVKYKNRKLQAVRKLKDTEQNLIRVKDIIGELETQVGPLKEQSFKAEKYLQFKKYLDELEISLLVNQIDDQQARLTEINRAWEEHNINLVEMETGLRSIESEVEEQKLRASKVEEAVNALMREIFANGSLIDQKESQIKVAQERIKDSEIQRKELTSEIDALSKKDAAEKNKQAEDLQFQVELREVIRAEENKLAEAQRQLDAIDTSFSGEQQDIEHKKADIIDLLNEMAGEKNGITSGETELQSLRRRLGQLDDQKESLQIEFAQLREKEAGLLQRESHCEESLRIQSEELQSSLGHKEQKREQVTKLNEASARKQDTMRHKTSRLKALKDLQNDYEGYNRGVKEVLTAAPKGKECRGICGVVAELVKVPEKFETAVEVALGGALQNIVTETDQHAKEAVEFLKKNKAGRATFLPLNTIRPSRDNNRYRNGDEQGSFGSAAGLVACDEKYRHIVEYLLGRVLIVENLSRALKMAAEVHYSMKIVTLDGDVINPGGSITGGSYKKGPSNLLSRLREIESMAAEQVELEKEINHITVAAKALQDELDANIKEVSQLEDSIRTLAMEKNALQKDMELVAQEKKRVEGFLATVADEKQYLANEVSNTEGRLVTLRENLVELTARDQNLRQEISRRQAALTGREKERSELAESVTVIKVELAGRREKETNHTKGIDRSQEFLAEIEIEINKKSGQIKQLVLQAQRLEEEARGLAEEVVELSKVKGDQEELLNQNRNQKQALISEITDKETIIKKRSRETTQLKETIHSEDIRRTRLEIEIENSLNKLRDDFNISPEDSLAQKGEAINRREVSGRIRALKEEIGALGSVNLGAIDEYKRVNDRYDFLSRQFADLEQAKDSLFRVIAEMDEIMISRFNEAFAEINENFGRVFKNLFAGGRAELRLSDPESVLESGIDIMAQPPGKKPQNLLLLSGGERALTAISLMFAVLQTKPTPFCILDEIEASLDEANLDRVARFLQDFDQKTQFIIITHRKRTMEAADILYGVTMDDSRVTKIVSMKLGERADKVS